MCWPSRVAATDHTVSVCPSKVSTSVPSTWYSRTSRRCLDIADHKVHAVGQRRDADHHLAHHLEGALECAVERPQLRGAVLRGADEARSARQHSHRPDQSGMRVDGALAHAVPPHPDGEVIRAGDDTAVGHYRHAIHIYLRAQSVTTSLLNGRAFLAIFAASQSTWHVGATAATSWASGSWYSTRPSTSVGSSRRRQPPPRAAPRGLLASRVGSGAPTAASRASCASSSKTTLRFPALHLPPPNSLRAPPMQSFFNLHFRAPRRAPTPTRRRPRLPRRRSSTRRRPRRSPRCARRRRRSAS